MFAGEPAAVVAPVPGVAPAPLLELAAVRVDRGDCRRGVTRVVRDADHGHHETADRERDHGCDHRQRQAPIGSTVDQRARAAALEAPLLIVGELRAALRAQRVVFPRAGVRSAARWWSCSGFVLRDVEQRRSASRAEAVGASVDRAALRAGAADSRLSNSRSGVAPSSASSSARSSRSVLAAHSTFATRSGRSRPNRRSSTMNRRCPGTAPRAAREGSARAGASRPSGACSGRRARGPRRRGGATAADGSRRRRRTRRRRVRVWLGHGRLRLWLRLPRPRPPVRVPSPGSATARLHRRGRYKSARSGSGSGSGSDLWLRLTIGSGSGSGSGSATSSASGSAATSGSATAPGSATVSGSISVTASVSSTTLDWLVHATVRPGRIGDRTPEVLLPAVDSVLRRRAQPAAR